MDIINIIYDGNHSFYGYQDIKKINRHSFKSKYLCLSFLKK